MFAIGLGLVCFGMLILGYIIGWRGGVKYGEALARNLPELHLGPVESASHDGRLITRIDIDGGTLVCSPEVK